MQSASLDFEPDPQKTLLHIENLSVMKLRKTNNPSSNETPTRSSCDLTKLLKMKNPCLPLLLDILLILAEKKIPSLSNSEFERDNRSNSIFHIQTEPVFSLRNKNELSTELGLHVSGILLRSLYTWQLDRLHASVTFLLIPR